MFEEKYSVFDKGYLDVPKSSTFEFREKAFFRLNKPGALAISLGDELSLVDKNVFRREGFWQLIISSIREEHGERHSVQNTLSNSVSVFSLGANPVKVAIEGLMLMDGTTDHLAQFFELYVKMLRAKRLKEDGRVLEFHLKDTSFRLLIDTITVSHSTEIDGYASVSIQGIAYHYSLNGFSTGLNLGYYGRNDSVPTGKTTPEEKPEAENKPKEDEISVVKGKE